MSNKFMGVSMTNWSDDRMFNLLLKYKITKKTSLEFVQKCIDKTPIELLNKYKIKDSLVDISIDKLLKEQTDDFTELKVDIDYICINDINYPKESFELAFIEFITCCGKIPMAQILQKYKGVECITYYITIKGLVNIITNTPERTTDKMDLLFHKLVWWCAIMVDTNYTGLY
jgi:hypothetical protein